MFWKIWKYRVNIINHYTELQLMKDIFCFCRLTDMKPSHEDWVSLASCLQSPDCPLRELDLRDIRLSGDDLSVVFSVLEGPPCKLETLRSVSFECWHDDNPKTNTFLDSLQRFQTRTCCTSQINWFQMTFWLMTKLLWLYETNSTIPVRTKIILFSENTHYIA